MNDEESQFSAKVRRMLDQDCARLDSRIGTRLLESRRQAMARQKTSGGLRLAGDLGRFGREFLLPQLRTVAAIAALMLGMIATYYWNTDQDINDYAEIDSDLLADDLPVAAYTDPGFHAWLDRSSSSQ